MGFILYPIAIILFAIVGVVYEFIMLFIGVYKRKWFKTVNQRKFNSSFRIDVLGNWLFADLWNVVYSKGGYQFGRFGETISSALGRKFIEESLSLFGLLWYYILYAADYTNWRKGGHCIANIQSDEQINNFLKE